MTSSSESHPEKPGPEARRDGFSTGLLWLLLFLLPLMFYHYWIPYRRWVHPLFFWLERRFDPGRHSVHLLEADDGRVALVIGPAPGTPKGPPPSRRPGIAWNVVLLALTFVTTTWAGASHRGLDMFRQPSHFWTGLSFSVPLLLILGVHELGHYFVARRRGVDASLPYFIPVPFGLGTFGAIIRIRSAFPDRRAAFDVGIAGPLVGLAVALPALIMVPVPHRFMQPLGIACPYL